MLLTLAIYGFSRRRPAGMKRLLRKQLERKLRPDFDIDTHFTPRYDPWDQRLCIVPDGDLFEAISDGRVSVVTDLIDTLTETGIALASGAQLEADLIVTATGLHDGAVRRDRPERRRRAVDLGSALVFRGMQLGGVPNMAFAFGYTNQSWTLGADLTCEQVCKLLEHMDRRGHSVCTPRNRDPSVTAVPFADLTSGYVLRSVDEWPKQGSRAPGSGSRTTRATCASCGARRSRTPRWSSAAPPSEPERLERRFPPRVLLVAEAVRADAAQLGQLRGDALHHHGEREHRQHLAQLALGEACDARSGHLHRARDRLGALGRRAAAVEHDQRVLLVERHARPVEELLGQSPSAATYAASRIFSAPS